ncbi:hypothetical protein JHK87_017379 [Glycine soja]|nr:hypothetical protein JHK87_017379 [Glycine soja]
MKGAGTVNFNCGNGSPAPPSSPPTQVSDRTFGGDCNGFDLGFSSETPPPPATSGTASPGTTARNMKCVALGLSMPEYSFIYIAYYAEQKNY